MNHETAANATASTIRSCIRRLDRHLAAMIAESVTDRLPDAARIVLSAPERTVEYGIIADVTDAKGRSIWRLHHDATAELETEIAANAAWLQRLGPKHLSIDATQEVRGRFEHKIATLVPLADELAKQLCHEAVTDAAKHRISLGGIDFDADWNVTALVEAGTDTTIYDGHCSEDALCDLAERIELRWAEINEAIGGRLADVSRIATASSGRGLRTLRIESANSTTSVDLAEAMA